MTLHGFDCISVAMPDAHTTTGTYCLNLEMQLAAAHEQSLASQEGWRAALAEKVRAELLEKEQALRQQLLQERNRDIEVGHFFMLYM